jgi:hypothetical protein
VPQNSNLTIAPGESTQISLGPREHVVLVHSTRLSLRCEFGCVWLTAEGKHEDLMMIAGQRTDAFPSKGSASLRAHGASVVSVTAEPARDMGIAKRMQRAVSRFVRGM